VWEVPEGMLEYAKSGGEMQRAKRLKSQKWKYEGVIPRAFRDSEGNYRICWIKKDPLRASYWYNFYDFSSDGAPKAASMSSIPSSLKEADPTKIPGW